ncbi:MAG: 4Fe-4S binding protein [Candidatus Cloacimonetes bacterium]|nr:4Fe-4S binding protein [Candidatus Cloacimonadota bacterium]
MTKIPQRGALINSEKGLQNSLLTFLKKAAEKKLFDAIMLPMQVPSGDSFAWILIKDMQLLDEATPIAPIMPVNAAKAVKRLTRKGEGSSKIAVLIKPCEVRACVELAKLNQIRTEDIIILSYDCLGALPMQDYIKDPVWGKQEFSAILESKNWNSQFVKPVCKICDKFSLSASDLHFGIIDEQLLAIANSEKGETLLAGMDMKADQELENWKQYIRKIRTKRLASKAETFEVIKTKVAGFANLLDTFSECIGCHNCQSACPICYCRQCYFDSAVSKPNSDVVLMRAEQRGGVSLPLDKIMFHTGRMAHMSLSCISCGLCSDACPVNIPVAKIFSYVASETQKTFEYTAGESFGDALPMKEYKPEELGELGKLVQNAEIQEGGHE